MSVAKIREHGEKYSKTYKKKDGRWTLDFEGMAIKTVLKLCLSKYAPLSVETIQSAVMFDQATIKDFENHEVEYSDATEVEGAAIELVDAEKKAVKEANKNAEQLKLA
jgi:recombination protein RecT